jgi:hypothetical protein
MAAKKPHKRAAGADGSGAQPGSDDVKPGSDDAKAGSDDVKARMKAALEAKNNRAKDVPHDSVQAKLKTNGPEVVGGAPKMHRRKSG